jgi:hypothetical protein
MLTYVTTIYEVNNFTKTLLFCANFLRKMTKINMSDQLLYFVILCTLLHVCVKHIVYKQTFHNVHSCDNTI